MLFSCQLLRYIDSSSDGQQIVCHQEQRHHIVEAHLAGYLNAVVTLLRS